MISKPTYICGYFDTIPTDEIQDQYGYPILKAETYEELASRTALLLGVHKVVRLEWTLEPLRDGRYDLEPCWTAMAMTARTFSTRRVWMRLNFPNLQVHDNKIVLHGAALDVAKFSIRAPHDGVVSLHLDTYLDMSEANGG